ncbi:MAG: dienelactone hydrolase family protein [Planctomycetota bacterium]
MLHEWEEDDVVLRVIRFRVGVFKGETARIAAIYGYPKDRDGGRRLPGLVQIHGGGQYADYKACLFNAHRGYATISLAWAGRISSPHYRVAPSEVKLFWEDQRDDPSYKLTTDWGAVDGYHAPSRNPGNSFPSVRAADWTLDPVDSPRNSGWFLCALAARRALTFLEQQPEVDADRLGVYGHSMGGKLTVMTAVDSRVKAAAPSCGGISDRDNRSELFRATLGDDVSLKQISCPIIFLSPANDFHGRIGDLPDAVEEISADQWRVTCSPHHNHQDTPPYEVATLLWFDEYLKGRFKFPSTPRCELQCDTGDGTPELTVHPDPTHPAHPVNSIDVFFTQQGKPDERPEDRLQTMHRFWHHATAVESEGFWTAKLPLTNTDRPLWVYANVSYTLEEPVTGAGYYYGVYTTDKFNVSSLLIKVPASELQQAGAELTQRHSNLIESFEGEWEKSWFTYRPNDWARSTNKLNEPIWQAPSEAALSLDVRSSKANQLVIVLDDHIAVVDVPGGDQWHTLTLQPRDFRNYEGEPLSDWNDIRQLTLSPAEFLRPKNSKAGVAKPKRYGKVWSGPAPRFRNLRWTQDPSTL